MRNNIIISIIFLFSFSQISRGNIIFSIDSINTTVSSKLESKSTLSLHEKLLMLRHDINAMPDSISVEMQTEENILSDMDKRVDSIHGIYDKVIEESRITSLLDPQETYTLPLALGDVIGIEKDIITIQKIQFTPQGGFLTASASIDVPMCERRMAFIGKEIQFHNKGITGNARIELLGNQTFNLTEKSQLVVKGDEHKTYVNWSCNGFESMGIQAEVEFSRDMLLPEDANGNVVAAPERVRGRFEIQEMQSWDELLVEVNLGAFQVTSIPDWSFVVSKAVLDYSDVANANGMNFPQGYSSPLLPEPGSNLWRGFYLEELEVTLPEQFTKGNSRAKLNASQLIIDDMGISGRFSGNNLIGIDEGNMDGWAFSLDSIGVTIIANELANGAFNGLLHLPIQEDGTELEYSGLIVSANDYLFNLQLADDVKVPLWAATLNLNEGSYIDVRVTESKFMPIAVLTGDISITGNNDSKIGVSGLEFEELSIQTVRPYVDVKAFALVGNSQNKMSKFPITISDVGMVTDDDDVGIKFTCEINLVGEGDGGFGAAAGFTLWGEPADNSRLLAYQYKSIDIDKIFIDIDGGAYEIKGGLLFYRNDPVYGDGFKGLVDAYFTPGIEVKATAQFGNLEGMRYWFADAQLILSTGIIIAPGFGIYGFSGGAYFRMKREAPDLTAPPPNYSTEELLQPGLSLSGVKYVPNADVFLGIRAGVVLGTVPSPKPFNGDVNFEVAFNNNGGVIFIGFDGKGYLMCDMKDRGIDAPVYASVSIEFDIPNKTLYGVSTVYVNLLDGLMEGINENGRAGTITMYFSPDEWYIYMGTPDDRIGLRMLETIEATTYFMVGTKIPSMPAPPAQVSEILGGMDFDMMRDENALGSGGGFAFGSSISMSTGDITFLMFYGSFELGFGFDLMLKNYGEGVMCYNTEENLGINGWYASGQAYSYFQGNIGIKVDLAFYKGNFDILDIGAAAVLQAKLPNPMWMRGVVGGYYNILNGMVKGNCQFEFTFGEECEMSEVSPVSGMEVIAEISPGNSSRDVNVFNSPQVAFNMPIEQIYSVEDMDGKEITFRVAFDYFRVRHNGAQLKGEYKWNTNKDVIIFTPDELLPSKQKITLEARVHFEEKIAGTWTDLLVEGKTVTEVMSTEFESGEAPDHIEHEYVEYSYPVINQLNFYKDEYNKGYITLKRGMAYLFDPGPEWRQEARLTSGGQALKFAFNYDNSTNTIGFNIPDGLSNNKIYNLQIVNVPAKDNAAMDANVSTVVENRIEDANNSLEITTKNIEGTLDILEEKEVYSAHLRTSNYNTLAQKINSQTITSQRAEQITSQVLIVLQFRRAAELFEEFEINGDLSFDPLIQMVAIESNSWLNKNVKPLIYNNYPINSRIIIANRDINELGLVPVKKITLDQHPFDYPRLTQQNIDNNYAECSGNYAYFGYDLAQIVDKDFSEIQTRVANDAINGTNKDMENILSSFCPIISVGDYEVNVNYVLPGKDIITSSVPITIVRPY